MARLQQDDEENSNALTGELDELKKLEADNADMNKSLGMHDSPPSLEEDVKTLSKKFKPKIPKVAISPVYQRPPQPKRVQYLGKRHDAVNVR